MKKLLSFVLIVMMTFATLGVTACNITSDVASGKGGASVGPDKSVTSDVTSTGEPDESPDGSAIDPTSDTQSASDGTSDSGQSANTSADTSAVSSDGGQSAGSSAESSASGSQSAGGNGEQPPQETQTDIKLYNYFKDETLPSIYINTEGGIAIDDNSLVDTTQQKAMGIKVYNYVGATISVTDAGEDYALTNVAAQVKVRGNYTSTYEKKPIRIKFDKKQKMAGLNGGTALKNWVLLAEYKDSSMLRNSVAFYLGNSLLEGHGGYSADFRYVKLYMNGNYHGMYVLTEQQQVNKNRVNVPEPKEPKEGVDESTLSEEEYAKLHDVHFGYFIEYDGYYTYEADLEKFTINYNKLKHINGTDCNPQPSQDQNQSQGGWGGGWGGWGGTTRTIGFTIKNDVYYAEQRDFIKKCMQTIWNVVYDATYKDHTNLTASPYHTMDAEGNYVVDTTITSAYDAVDKVVDIKSLVDMYIIQELCQDMDISWSSFFFSLDMSPKGDKKLTYTAPWDFDSSLGSASGSAATNALYGMNTDNPWLVVFAGQKWFWQLVNERFTEAETAGVFTGVIQMIDDFTSLYVTAYAENYTRWPNSIGRKIEGQQVNDIANFKTQAQASAYLKNWINTKLASMKALIKAQAES